jgi:hypothetical protein
LNNPFQWEKDPDNQENDQSEQVLDRSYALSKMKQCARRLREGDIGMMFKNKLANNRDK